MPKKLLIKRIATVFLAVYAILASEGMALAASPTPEPVYTPSAADYDSWMDLRYRNLNCHDQNLPPLQLFSCLADLVALARHTTPPPAGYPTPLWIAESITKTLNRFCFGYYDVVPLGVSHDLPGRDSSLFVCGALAVMRDDAVTDYRTAQDNGSSQPAAGRAWLLKQRLNISATMSGLLRLAGDVRLERPNGSIVSLSDEELAIAFDEHDVRFAEMTAHGLMTNSWASWGGGLAVPCLLPGRTHPQINLLTGLDRIIQGNFAYPADRMWGACWQILTHAPVPMEISTDPQYLAYIRSTFASILYNTFVGLRIGPDAIDLDAAYVKKNPDVLAVLEFLKNGVTTFDGLTIRNESWTPQVGGLSLSPDLSPPLNRFRHLLARTLVGIGTGFVHAAADPLLHPLSLGGAALTGANGFSLLGDAAAPIDAAAAALSAIEADAPVLPTVAIPPHYYGNGISLAKVSLDFGDPNDKSDSCFTPTGDDAVSLHFSVRAVEGSTCAGSSGCSAAGSTLSSFDVPPPAVVDFATLLNDDGTHPERWRVSSCQVLTASATGQLVSIGYCGVDAATGVAHGNFNVESKNAVTIKLCAKPAGKKINIAVEKEDGKVWGAGDEVDLDLSFDCSHVEQNLLGFCPDAKKVHFDKDSVPKSVTYFLPEGAIVVVKDRPYSSYVNLKEKARPAGSREEPKLVSEEVEVECHGTPAECDPNIKLRFANDGWVDIAFQLPDVDSDLEPRAVVSEFYLGDAKTKETQSLHGPIDLGDEDAKQLVHGNEYRERKAEIEDRFDYWTVESIRDRGSLFPGTFDRTARYCGSSMARMFTTEEFRYFAPAIGEFVSKYKSNQARCFWTSTTGIEVRFDGFPLGKRREYPTYDIACYSGATKDFTFRTIKSRDQPDVEQYAICARTTEDEGQDTRELFDETIGSIPKNPADVPVRIGEDLDGAIGALDVMFKPNPPSDWEWEPYAFFKFYSYTFGIESLYQIKDVYNELYDFKKQRSCEFLATLADQSNPKVSWRDLFTAYGMRWMQRTGVPCRGGKTRQALADETINNLMGGGQSLTKTMLTRAFLTNNAVNKCSTELYKDSPLALNHCKYSGYLDYVPGVGALNTLIEASDKCANESCGYDARMLFGKAALSGFLDIFGGKIMTAAYKNLRQPILKAASAAVAKPSGAAWSEVARLTRMSRDLVESVPSVGRYSREAVFKGVGERQLSLAGAGKSEFEAGLSRLIPDGTSAEDVVKILKTKGFDARVVPYMGKLDHNVVEVIGVPKGVDDATIALKEAFQTMTVDGGGKLVFDAAHVLPGGAGGEMWTGSNIMVLTTHSLGSRGTRSMVFMHEYIHALDWIRANGGRMSQYLTDIKGTIGKRMKAMGIYDKRMNLSELSAFQRDGQVSATIVTERALANKAFGKKLYVEHADADAEAAIDSIVVLSSMTRDLKDFAAKPLVLSDITLGVKPSSDLVNSDLLFASITSGEAEFVIPICYRFNVPQNIRGTAFEENWLKLKVAERVSKWKNEATAAEAHIPSWLKDTRSGNPEIDYKALERMTNKELGDQLKDVFQKMEKAMPKEMFKRMTELK